MRQTLKKEEIIRSRNSIDSLFKKGKWFQVDYFKVIHLEIPHEIGHHVQLGISIPKKFQKRAVDRNFLKRRIKEAYRINKHDLIESHEGKEKQLIFMLIYNSNRLDSYKNIEDKIILILQRLQDMYG